MLIMATGGGKSVCFQLPPLILSRAALIISPTIAIMKDQVSVRHAVTDNVMQAFYLTGCTMIKFTM